ncbi:sodium/solute symporter [Sphingobacterium sp. SRCM116780]|uniref:sodium:solute symporter family transporter n=1 Tax=Sphingobacterium sp. SRCM116780 TaxID=2907623 RepID=UPI001EE9ED2C|nr:sodium/solute symporter [Sphingobacterium sp. SRCM116780]UIR56965.1 sodium/solute symporter [Sphingobacterium sp. SRCM116780]
MTYPVTYEIVVLLLYFIGIIILSFYLSKKQKVSSESYFLANRSASWLVVGFSLFATSISSTTLIGQIGDAYLSGFSVYNYNLTGAVVLVFFAIFLLPLYIKSRIFTIPQFLELRYDKKARYYFSFITIISSTFLDASAALYAGAIIFKQLLPQLSIQEIVIIFSIITALFTIPRGLSVIIKIEVINAIIILISSIALAIFCFNVEWTYFIDLIQTNSDTIKLLRPAGDLIMPWTGVLFGMPILGIYFWANNQTMVQRVLGAKNINEGRKGLLLTAILSLIAAFLITTTGILAKELVPGVSNPDAVYPTLLFHYLPTVLRIFILLALFSTLTTTLSAIINSASTLLTIDFYTQLKPTLTSSQKVIVGKIFSIILLVIACIWAPFISKYDSLLKYYQEMLSYLAPPIVSLFIAGIFFKRVNAKGAFIGFLGSSILSVLIFLTKETYFPTIHFLNIVPFSTLFGMFLIYLSSLLFPKPSDQKLENLLFSWDKFKNDLNSHKSYYIACLLTLMLISLCWFIF